MPINGVAISNHADDPLIVTASDDKTARVWSRGHVGELWRLTHPAGVRSIACAPPGCQFHYCLTGGDDGIARLWDLDARADQKLRDLEGFQHKAITAVAFSPDGKYCATADNRDICLWDVATGKLLYQFPQLHRGAITTLAFTKQTKLVSAARDNTIRVWSLGEKGAALDYMQEGRSGDIGQIGVSHDGGKVLLDTPQDVRIMTVEKRGTEGAMKNTGDSAKFATFATFSADDRLVLTGLNTEGRLSVWLAPSATARAAEVRRLNPQDRAAVFTCGVISPFVEQPFAATGTQDGTLYLWPMPTLQQLKDELIEGEIKFVDDQTDASSQQIRVWANFDNKTHLVAGGAVTMVAFPDPKK
jgi:WD40 repeat protein